METKIVKVDRKHPQADIMRPDGFLKDGGLVASDGDRLRTVEAMHLT